MLRSRHTGAAVHPSRLWLFIASAAVALAAAYWAHVVASEREAAMDLSANRATAALAAARRGGAATWAPDQLTAAEQAWREGLAARTSEESRLWPIPDATRVVKAFSTSAVAATEALARAAENRAAAAEEASALIADADAAVEVGEVLATTIHFGRSRRRLLSQARGALAEARVYASEEDFASAARRARDATALMAQMREHAVAVTARYADAGTIARWRQWSDATVEWSRREGRAAIVVSKEAHLLTLYVAGRAVKRYPIELGYNWTEDKLHEGDGATPEGRYRVVARKGRGASIYYKAFLIDYPNAQDHAEFGQAKRRGLVAPSARIGGLIEIHGEGGQGHDWTNGCVAVTNREMDDLFARVDVGTPVTIVGNDGYGAFAGLARERRAAQALGGR